MSLKLTLAPLWLLAACGTVSPDTIDGTPAADAPAVDATAVDAPAVDADIDGPDTDAPPPRCNPTAPFQAPTALTSINSAASEESASLSPDELTIYFSSTRTGTLGGYDLFVATRADRSAAFGNVTRLAGVNTADHERTPNVSADGLHLYARAAVGADNGVVHASRTETTSPFSPLSPVAILNSAGDEEISYILPDHRAVYLHSNREGNYQLYRAQYNGQFSAPTTLGGAMLNTAAHESGGAVTPDELTLVFASNRVNPDAFDIYLATRASTADGFGAPAPLALVNSATNEWPSWMSHDGCVLYLTRSVAAGNYDLFVSVRGM